MPAQVVGAIIAFFGVIIGLAFNLLMSRISYNREINTLRVALKSELNQLLNIMYSEMEKASITTDPAEKPKSPYDMSQHDRRDRIRKRAEEVRDGQFTGDWSERYGTLFPIVSYFIIYEKNLDKIGRLTEDEVDRITFAYYRYQERIGRMLAHASPDQAKKPQPGDNVMYKYEDFKFRNYFLTDVLDITYAAEWAREEMQKNTSSNIL